MGSISRRRSPVHKVVIEADRCSSEEVRKIVSGLPFLQGLAEADLIAISARFRQIGFAAGRTIHLAGSPAGRLSVVAEGTVKLLRPTLDGHDVLIDFLNRGEFFGNLTGAPGERNSESAVAHTSVCLLAVGVSVFHSILERHSSIAVRLLALTAQRLNGAHDMIRLLSARPVERRIASALLRLSERLGQPGTEGNLIQLPLSRSDVAEMVGTTAETSSRVMSRLEASGIIETGRRWVSIRDRDKLVRAAKG